MNRILSIILILIMTAGIMTGCGSGKEENTPADTSVTGQASQGADETKEIPPELTDSWYSCEKLFGADSYTITFAAKVQNTDGNHYWTWVPVEVKLLDADGSEIGAGSESITVIEPGAAQAVVGVASCKTEPAEVIVALAEEPGNASKEAPEDYIKSGDFELSEIQIGAKNYAGISASLTGKAKNNSDRGADRLKYTILFNKDGKIAGASTGFIYGLEAAGAEADFEELTLMCDYDSYDIYLNGTAAQ